MFYRHDGLVVFRPSSRQGFVEPLKYRTTDAALAVERPVKSFPEPGFLIGRQLQPGHRRRAAGARLELVHHCGETGNPLVDVRTGYEQEIGKSLQIDQELAD